MRNKTIVAIIFFLVFVVSTGICQDWIKQQKDIDFLNRVNHGLRVGDTMPDILLGPTINNEKGVIRFGEFKGKLVILDFWATWCSDCIAGFPKMEALQKRFGDTIQIILVNTRETKEEIETRLIEIKERALKNGDSSGKSYYIPNMFQIVKSPIDSIMSHYESIYFPIRGIPHHVWIDPTGKIRIRGGSPNTYEKKISDLLNGKKILSINDLNTTILLRPGNEPYSAMMRYFKELPLQQGVTLTGFNNEYFAFGGGSELLNIVDSVQGTRRDVFINRDFLDIYKISIKTYLDNWNKDILFAATKNDDGKFPAFVLCTKDTFRYTSWFKHARGGHGLKDYEINQSKVCIEQLIPINISDSMAKDHLKRELELYALGKYGTQILKEKRKVKCYALIRTTTEDQINSVSSKTKMVSINAGNEQRIRMQNCPISAVLRTVLDNTPLDDWLSRQQKIGKAFIIVNETGFDVEKKHVDMELPCGRSLVSISQLRNTLNTYGLDLVEKEKIMEFIIVKDQ